MKIDPAAEANELADHFYSLSQAVDDFRLGLQPPLAGDQMDRLQDASDALEDRAHYFTADAIGATLQAIAPDLAQIKAVTAQAAAQLGVLQDIDKGISIATLALNLGASITGGDPAAIMAASKDLADELATI